MKRKWVLTSESTHSKGAYGELTQSRIKTVVIILVLVLVVEVVVVVVVVVAVVVVVVVVVVAVIVVHVFMNVWSYYLCMLMTWHQR